jgi:hypothetical protein
MQVLDGWLVVSMFDWTGFLESLSHNLEYSPRSHQDFAGGA